MVLLDYQVLLEIRETQDNKVQTVHEDCLARMEDKDHQELKDLMGIL